MDIEDYNNICVDISYKCKCGYIGYGKIDFSIEMAHPLNKGLWYNHPDLHTTEVHVCPVCKKWIATDGVGLYS